MHLVHNPVLISILGRSWSIAVECATPKNLGDNLLLAKFTVIIDNHFLVDITFPKVPLTIVYIYIWLLILKTFIWSVPLDFNLMIPYLRIICWSEMAKNVVCLSILSDGKVSFL